MISPLTPDEQFQALNILTYLADLFTCAKKESFTRTEILIVLDHVRSMEDLFEPAVVIAHQEATAHLS